MLRIKQPGQFFECFKSAVDDANFQFLKMLNARKSLFEHDILNQRECGIKIEKDWPIVMVNWSVDEPGEVAPLRYPPDDLSE
jgi:hypothetical protein